MYKVVGPNDLKDGCWYWVLIDELWVALEYMEDMHDEWVNDSDIGMVCGPIPTPDEGHDAQP